MAESCFLSKDWCALTDHAKSCRCWWSHNTETRTRVQQRKWETSALGQNNSWIPAPGTGRLCPGILRKKNNKQKNEGLYGCDIYLKPSACWWNENHSRITWKDTCARESRCDLSFKFYSNPGIWIVTRELHGKRKWRLLVAVHHVLERQLIPEAKFLLQSQSITACNKKGKMSSYSDVHFDWVLYEESVIFLPKPSISSLEFMWVHFMHLITFISFLGICLVKYPCFSPLEV